MSNPDALTDRISRAASTAVSRRRTNVWLIFALSVLAIVNALGWIAVGLVTHRQEEDRRHRTERETLSDRRFDDIYRGMNNISGQLGNISPVPPGTIVLVPPTGRATTTTTVRPATSTTRASQPPTSSTTTTTGRPPSTTTTTRPTPPTTRCAVPVVSTIPSC